MSILIKKFTKKIREKAKAKEKAERDYTSRQASVDTEISKTATNTDGSSTPRRVATGGSTKDNLRIKRKNYSSMYSGAGRNIV